MTTNTNRRTFIKEGVMLAAFVSTSFESPMALPSLIKGSLPDHPFPKIELFNGLVKATVYLPDPVAGYYRGARFDWSGVVSSLEYGGHQYHGEWFDKHDPLRHDGIVGPVEEFGPLGFETAAVGEEFVKIGIGSLIKPDENAYVFHKPYVLSNQGMWSIENNEQQVSFTHVLEGAGYSYEYKKVLDLPDGEPKLVLSHTLKNTGDRVIETRVYNHNFFVIDNEPTGPSYRVTVPGYPLSTQGSRGLGDIVKLKGSEIIFLRELQHREQAYFPDLSGGQPVDYSIGVENVKSGAGVKITGDRPIIKMVFWASPTTVCPEPYIDIRVEPGQTFSWTINYQYYH